MKQWMGQVHGEQKLTDKLTYHFHPLSFELERDFASPGDTGNRERHCEEFRAFGLTRARCNKASKGCKTEGRKGGGSTMLISMSQIKNLEFCPETKLSERSSSP